MQAFSYVSAKSVSEASAILAQEGDNAKILSGGTDIIVQLREGRRSAQVVVDVKAIPELNELSYDARSGLTVGAAVPLHRIYSDAKLAAMYPALMDSAKIIGGSAIQGRATLGGNVCTASPAGDSLPTLIALGASCVVAGAGGTREIAVENFFAGPGRTVLQKGDLLVAFKLPAPQPNSGAAYLRFIPRNEMDIAVVSAGVFVQLDAAKAKFTAARIALGAVAPTPLFVPEAGAALVGRPVGAAAIAAAAEAAKAAARPISDMRGTAEQRRHLSGVMTKRALEIAVERARA